MKPARLVHRLTKSVEDLESARQDTLMVERFLNGKYVTVGNQRVAYSCRGQVRWTEYANSRYSAEQLE
eukprot:1783590-Karenia_brevis.AAC.1